METKDRELAQADRAARIEALVRQLSETEHTLQELLAGEVDAVIDPVRGTPIILRQAQAALRRSEARMRLLLAHIPALVWTTDENLCMTSTAGRELEAVREAIGMRAEALVGHSLVDVAREHKALAGVLAAHYRALEGQTASYDTTIERRIFHGTIEPLCDESGQIVGCVGLGLDVTHQRRIEDVFGGRLSAARHKLEALAERSSGLPTKYRALVEEVLESSSIAVEELQVSVEELHQQNEELATMQNELEASRRSYQDLFESAPDGYLVTDPAGIIRRANRAAVELLGVSKRVLQDKPLVIYVAQEERAEFHRRLDQVQAGKKQARSEWELHMRNRAYDSIFPAALTVSPIRDQEGTLTGLRWLLRDQHTRPRDPGRTGHRQCSPPPPLLHATLSGWQTLSRKRDAPDTRHNAGRDSKQRGDSDPPGGRHRAHHSGRGSAGAQRCWPHCQRGDRVPGYHRTQASPGRD